MIVCIGEGREGIKQSSRNHFLTIDHLSDFKNKKKKKGAGVRRGKTLQLISLRNRHVIITRLTRQIGVALESLLTISA